VKILAFAATTSRNSINRQLVAYATHLLEDGRTEDVTVETIDLNDYEMPIYSIDREAETGIPSAAHDFFDRIGQADAVLISFAEHNGHYTAAYKNIFDWVSRIDKRVYQGKPTVMLATSPGPSGGSNVLAAAVTSGRFFGNDVLASLSIPHFHDSFDAANKRLTDPGRDGQLRAALATFSAGVERQAA
jgi:NAD(P)H-dependent FMN reductase